MYLQWINNLLFLTKSDTVLTETATWKCDRLHRNGYSDWYLPSSTEWINANNRIGTFISGTLFNKLSIITDVNQKYWSSNNWISDYALASSSTTLKNQYHRVRAVQKF